MDSIIVKDVVPPTLSIHAIQGRFCGVTYYMATMPLSECAEHLEFEDINEISSFRERVQRTLNTKRAQDIFDNYLAQDKTRFFNSLVVVLMPRDRITTGYYEFTPFKTDRNDQLEVGTLKVLSKIQRIVVDGQHRLHALRAANQYTRDDTYDEKLKLKEAMIPVVFITFDCVEGEGFNNKFEESINKQISDQARGIFVDLNKNAKKADKNTLLILDDYDFSAVAARHLIESNNNLDIYTKWDRSGTTLSDIDIFYTTIDLLSTYIEEIITTEGCTNISNHYTLSLDQERDSALKKYLSAPNQNQYGLKPEEMILSFFNDVTFFSDWENNIYRLLSSRKPVLQPKKENLDNEQKRNIKEFRQKELLATVVGQEVAFRALCESYPHFEKDTAKENFDCAIQRLNEIYTNEIFTRQNPLWLELLVRPGNKMKLTTVADSVRTLKGLIEGDTTVIKEHIKPRIDEGVGTAETETHYMAALDMIRTQT